MRNLLFMLIRKRMHWHCLLRNKVSCVSNVNENICSRQLTCGIKAFSFRFVNLFRRSASQYPSSVSSAHPSKPKHQLLPVLIVSNRTSYFRLSCSTPHKNSSPSQRHSLFSKYTHFYYDASKEKPWRFRDGTFAACPLYSFTHECLTSPIVDGRSAGN